MSRAIRILLAAALATSTSIGVATAAPEPPEKTASTAPRVIQGRYLVTLKFGADVQQILDTLKVPRALFVYGSVFTEFAADLTEAQKRALRVLPVFDSIENDAEVQLFTKQGRPRAVGSWGLDRINQRDLPLDGTYSPAHDGSTVTAYILDTGIQHGHSEFDGRATFGYDAMGDGRRGEDCNGHGTHVAGTVGGATYGVAKKVRLVSVRVLGCDGRGSWSGIVAGLDWIGANARKPAVVNGSLGGTPSSSVVDNAANAVADKGVFVSIAGGNDAADACGYSPARAARVFTIGATTISDGYAHYSNRGQCVQLLAPGTDITSAWLGNTTRTISGTSMATPHVAGVAALYKQTYGDRSQADITNWMWNNATVQRVSGVPNATPNYLLHLGGL